MPSIFNLAMIRTLRALSRLPAVREPPLLCRTRPDASRIPHIRAMATATQYKSIRMHDSEDDARAYQLIPAYLENPDLALSVKEFSIEQNCGEAWQQWVGE